MNVVHLNCKQPSRNQCGLILRSCRKNGLLVQVHVMDAVKSVLVMKPWILKKMYLMMILKTMITCSKDSFRRLQRGSGNFVTSKMELFKTIEIGYILDMARFLGLSLDYVAMLFIGLVLCKKIFYVIGSIFVKYYSVKSFFKVFEIINKCACTVQILIILRSSNLS